MKILLVDGQWNLKRNFYKRLSQTARFEKCGGVFGFLESLRSVISKTLPDRVVVMWDGFNAGKFRYDIYKPYKANRGKKWEAEKQMIQNDGTGNKEDEENFELLKQRIKLKDYLDDLFIRHLEMDFIEADDLIATYLLKDENPDNRFIVYSTDKDFLQLIDERTSVLTPNNFEMITTQNFNKVYGYSIHNRLLIRCFEGDTADGIKGVSGVTAKKLLEYFPRLAQEKYTYNRMVEEASELKKTKKLKFFDKIVEARYVLYRNAKLMDLKKPFINDDVVSEINKILNNSFDFSNRNILTAINRFNSDGFNKFVNSDILEYFFSPFYHIMTKEKEFSKLKK